MKIKIKQTIETESEVELSLPAYFTHDGCEHKMLSETKRVSVRPKIDGSDWCYAYSQSTLQFEWNKIISEGVLSTEENFMAALLSVQSLVNRLVEENSVVNQDF